MGQIEAMQLKLCPPCPASSQEFSKFYDEPMGQISFLYQSSYTNPSSQEFLLDLNKVL